MRRSVRPLTACWPRRCYGPSSTTPASRSSSCPWHWAGLNSAHANFHKSSKSHLTTNRSTLESLEPFTARVDGGPVIAYTLPITVPLQGSAVLRVRYNQMLEDQNGLVSYTYPITATARWSGTPESLRVTLNFSPPLPADQVLSRVPAARRGIGMGSPGTGTRNAPTQASVSPLCRRPGGRILRCHALPQPRPAPAWWNTLR